GRGNGGMVHIAYFRGSGYGSYRTEEPTISHSLISDTILSESYATMNYYNSTEKFSNLLSLKNKIHRTDITVKEPNVPFGLRSIAYFWGVNFLLGANNCVNKTTSTAASGSKFCDTEVYDRCARDIKEAPSLSNFNFLAPKGHRLTQFAWTCPNGYKCCNWECCEVDTMDWPWFEICAVAILIGLCFLAMIASES
ncbi:hypothetical protein PFISCL1PPCAC_2473, partial [Pristionchus fissidentatus]